LGTFLALPAASIGGEIAEFPSHLLPIVGPDEQLSDLQGTGPRIVEVQWHKEWRQAVARVKKRHPTALISLSILMTEDAMEHILPAVSDGIAIIHLAGSYNGKAADNDGSPLKDGIRSIHLKLVEEGVRDGITLLASGGLAMAEHVAKAIVCGVDAVMIDFPVLIALECRDIRRLRGEAGRAIFFEETDRSVFGSLGEVKEGCELE
jgi:hypothetical protein